MMEAENVDTEPSSLVGEADRLTAHVRRFSALSILVATPINLILTFVAGFAQSQSGTNFLGVVGMPQLAPFLISCYCFFGGFASVFVASRTPVSPRGISTRKIMLGIAFTGTGSVPVVLGIVWYVLNTHSLIS